MAEDRSLDEFIGADQPSDSATESAAEAVDPPEEGADPGDVSATDQAPTVEAEDPIEPMAETFAWSGGTAECANCGGAVEERWRDGDALVCGDCKPW